LATTVKKIKIKAAKQILFKFNSV